MDTASTLMGLGLLFVFMAPIGYLLVDQSQQEKKRKKAILAAAAKQQLNLNEHDFLPDLSIGLDEEAQKLIIVYFGKKQKQEVIDLKDMSRCELGKRYENDKLSSAIDDVREVYLEMVENGSSKKLVFYSEDAHPVTEKEMRMQMGKKWQQLLSEKIG